jgi:hypothetical protein
MRKVFFILTCICLLAIFGCDVNPSKLPQGDANELAEKLTYTKDERTGLCFAVVASRKTAHASQSGLGLTEVPCDKVERFIK